MKWNNPFYSTYISTSGYKQMLNPLAPVHVIYMKQYFYIFFNNSKIIKK